MRQGWKSSCIIENDVVGVAVTNMAAVLIIGALVLGVYTCILSGNFVDVVLYRATPVAGCTSLLAMGVATMFVAE